MIEAAEAMKSRCDEYRVAGVQKLGFLDSETFDLAVSYLNQCDLPDFHANNRKVFRVLKHGGRFIVANLHPLKSAVGGWQRLTMERSFTSFSTDTSRKVSASGTC
jgi:SAM-dependent methyltransferase